MRRALLTLAVLCVTCAAASDSTPLRLVASVDLPKYSGDFDHFAADVNGNRLFLAAEDHGTLEVFDLKSTRWLRTIRGFEVPHSILYLPASQKLLVTDGERGYCQLEKLHNLETLPDDGFTVVCFPVKIARASAGWTRAVALVDE